MSILKISGLSHMFEDKTLFKNADLSINNGEHIGIVGLNGAGKSTFINIIAKNIMWDEGDVVWLNGIRYGYLDQHANIDRSLSVMDYLKSAFDHLRQEEVRMQELYDSMGDIEDPDVLEKMIEKANRILERLTDEHFFEIDSEIKKVAEGLGIGAFGYDTVIGTLSGGQRAKVMLAKLMLEDLDVMLLDEPTNFLDVEHIDWLIKYLNGLTKTFMVISHDTDFLNAISKYIVSIENGTIKKYSGNYDKFIEQHEMSVRQYEEDYNRQQAEIKKMEEYIAKNKARAATAGMANSRKKMLDRIDVMDKPKFIADAHFSFPSTLVNTNNMLSVENLVIGYNNQPLLSPINLQIKGDTKIWIRGINGIGKSTFLKTIMGFIPKIDGSIHFHPAAIKAYLEQDLEFRNSDANAYSYISDCFPKLNTKEVRAELSKVGIKGDMALKPVNKLSGGEQVRIRLLTIMNVTSNILILDEPTNHLDVKAKDALEQALKEYNGCLVLVSHEKAFAEAVCDSEFLIK